MPPTYVELLSSAERGEIRNCQRVIDLYDGLRPSLQAYLCCLGMTSDQANDVIQETFLRLVRHMHDHQEENNLRGWVFRVAHNLTMDLHRSQRRWFDGNEKSHAVFVERIDPSPNPEQKLLLDERHRRLGSAVAQLTPKQRHCLLLRAEGLRYWEIATTLGVSVQRVGELVQRAISLLEGAA